MAAVHAAIGGVFQGQAHYAAIKERGIGWNDWVVPHTGFFILVISSSFNQTFSIMVNKNNNFVVSGESKDYITNNITMPVKQGDVINVNAPNDPNYFREYVYVAGCLFY